MWERLKVKIRYRVYFSEGPQIRKNPSPQDLLLWDSQGMKYEKLEGYETLTTREADPKLLVSLVDDKIEAHLENIREQLNVKSDQLERLTKIVSDTYADQDAIIEILEDTENLAKGASLLAIAGVILGIIALVKLYVL